MTDDKDYPTKADYESYVPDQHQKIPRTSAAFDDGVRSAAAYEEEELLEMLQSSDIIQMYTALGAIGKRKIKKALPLLQSLALYDDDIAIQEEAIWAIKRIGGKAAKDILRFLKTTEHKEFIEEVMIANKYVD